MTTVTVSVYQDASLLANCLKSIRSHIPDADIRVVDGKYDTFKPDAPPNSTDRTPDVAAEYGATYDAAGPFPLERDKHIYRVESAPEGERLLLIDADERLIDWHPGQLPEGKAIGPRVYNALVYGPHAIYWPRITFPENVVTINSWDAYLFDVGHERSDAVTILHRHDLRDREYRQAKYDRFDREDRTGRYDDSFDTYLNDDWDADFHTCPECGHDSVTRSQVTDLGPDNAMSYVEACVRGDGCHHAIVPVTVGEWRYVPDRIDAGFAEDPQRLRVELLDAGCTFVRTSSVRYMAQNMRPAIELWAEGEIEGLETPT